MPESWRRSPLSGLPPDSVLLVSDFDGTLADIVGEPGLAALRPDAAIPLSSLAERMRGVVVLSGRGSSDLRRLVPIPGVAALGDYGIGAPTPDERTALGRFNQAAADLIRDLPGVRLEPKPVATSLHFRNHPPSGQPLLELVAPLATAAGLRARLGRMVIEVTVARANKADALDRLIRQCEPGGVIYLGDDENDRPAFELLARSPLASLTVGVDSTEVSDDLFAACDVILPGVGSVAVFLSLLAGWAERPGVADPRAAG